MRQTAAGSHKNKKAGGGAPCTMWGRDSGISERLRADGITLAGSYPDKKIAVHWGMMMAAFPVFADIARLIDKMSDY